MAACRSGKSFFSRFGTNDGFSMAELIVVMGIFIIVIMISSNAFKTIAQSSSKLIKSSDSNIQGVVGLEIMRSDLESAGYGLPWSSPSNPFIFNYDESKVTADSLAKGINPADFNDINIPSTVDPKRTPRAVQSAAAGTGAAAWELGRDYLVIKSTAVGKNAAAKKWSYLEGLAAASSLKEWGTADDLAAGDRVVTLKATSVNKKPYRDLVAVSATDFSYEVPAKSGGVYTPPTGYQADSSDVFLVYGINSTPTAVPSFPYNRVDYYIKRPTASRDIPSRCAPGTGILYRAALNHANGETIPDPLLDCVADMQVVYSLDTTNDGGANQWWDDLSGLSAEEIRSQLKEIRVYILAQDGQRDAGYTYPSNSVQVGDRGGRAYNLSQLDGIGSDWQRYRWKIYTIVVAPRNINN